MNSELLVVQPVGRSGVESRTSPCRQWKATRKWIIPQLIVMCAQIISPSRAHADDATTDRAPFWIFEQGEQEVAFYAFNLGDQNERYSFPVAPTVVAINLSVEVGGRTLVATLRPKEVNVTWGGVRVLEFAKLPAEQRGFELVLEPKTRLVRAGSIIVRCDKDGDVESIRVLGQAVPSEGKKRPGRPYYSVSAESDGRTKVVYHPAEKKPKT